MKIDGSYVRNAAEDERDRSFAAAMVDLSRSVGADAIAEQIETEAVAQAMQGIGVRYGQGWLFGQACDLPTVVAGVQHVGQIRDGRRPKAPKKSESGDF